MACPPSYCGPPNSCYPGQGYPPAPCYPSGQCYPSTQCYPSNYCNPCQPVCKQTSFTGSNSTIKILNQLFPPAVVAGQTIPAKEQMSYNLEINGCGLSVVGSSIKGESSQIVQYAGCTTANTNCFTVTVKITESASYGATTGTGGTGATVPGSNLSGNVGVLYGTLKITCCGGSVSGCLVGGLTGFGLWNGAAFAAGPPLPLPTPFSAGDPAPMVQIAGNCCTTCGVRTINFTSINICYTATTAKPPA